MRGESLHRVNIIFKFDIHQHVFHYPNRNNEDIYCRDIKTTWLSTAISNALPDTVIAHENTKHLW